MRWGLRESCNAEVDSTEVVSQKEAASQNRDERAGTVSIVETSLISARSAEYPASHGQPWMRLSKDNLLVVLGVFA